MSSNDNNQINNQVENQVDNDEKVKKIVKKRGRRPKNKTELDNSVEVLPKKRGRKPKIKEPEDTVKIPKKRGRKPKVKDPNEPVKIPKKRGRKPKQKSYGVGNPVNTPSEINPENIILHLPIKSEKILHNEFQDKTILKYDPQISIPIGNETSGLETSNFSWINWYIRLR